MIEEKSWRKEGCICPKMDNDDVGFHMYYTVGCPVHKEVIENATKR